MPVGLVLTHLDLLRRSRCLGLWLCRSHLLPSFGPWYFLETHHQRGCNRWHADRVISTTTYVLLFTSNIIPGLTPPLGPEDYLFGIKPTSFGIIGMTLNLIVTIIVSRFTPPPPASVQAEVEAVRYPSSGEEQALVDH